MNDTVVIGCEIFLDVECEECKFSEKSVCKIHGENVPEYCKEFEFKDTTGNVETETISMQINI